MATHLMDLRTCGHSESSMCLRKTLKRGEELHSCVSSPMRISVARWTFLEKSTTLHKRLHMDWTMLIICGDVLRYDGPPRCPVPVSPQSSKRLERTRGVSLVDVSALGLKFRKQVVAGVLQDIGHLEASGPPPSTFPASVTSALDIEINCKGLCSGKSQRLPRWIFFSRCQFP